VSLFPILIYNKRVDSLPLGLQIAFLIVGVVVIVSQAGYFMFGNEKINLKTGSFWVRLIISTLIFLLLINISFLLYP
jgi:hypothetical protein